MKQLESSLAVRLLFHAVVSGQLGYAVYYDYNYAQLPWLAIALRLVPPIGGKFNYLTFLTAALHTFYYLLALISDLCPVQGLRQLRDFLLATFVVPLALTVSVTFWLLVATNCEAIYPPFLNEMYPWWLTLTLHALIVCYAALEIHLEPHCYPQRWKGFSALAAGLVSYLVWMHLVYFWTGVWIYPFLGGFFEPFRWFFFGLIVSSAFVYYWLGERLNCMLWAQCEWRNKAISGPHFVG
ncbi:androgen-induced gene 1 protein [Drosophila nasuta]|uniref:androgen-induced gene 1 protein n=1 Tax=Drosophila nasuta TaxID=42062 RepID=UPI00295F39DD|nr:androgen-induced gene 1 protein [Drosophila nasuta]